MSEQYKVLRGNVLTGSEMYGHTINDANIDIRYSVKNASNRTLWMCRSDGSIIELKPTSFVNHNSLLIVHNTFPGTNTLAWIEGYEDANLRKISQGSVSQRRVEWEEEISIDDIINNVNGVYINSCDIIITADYVKSRQLHHPKCLQKIHNDYISAITKEGMDNFINLGIRLIDNSGNIGAMYTVLNDKVQRLIPIADVNQLDGLYITGFVDYDSHGNRSTRLDERYTFEEVTKGQSPFKLYRSMQEAISARDQDILKIKELDESAIKRQYEKEMAQMKFENDKYILELNQRVKELEASIKEKDAEYNRRKSERDDEYHEAKHKRNMEAEFYQAQIDSIKATQEKITNDNKIFLETIKTIGIIISGGLAIRAFLSKS